MPTSILLRTVGVLFFLAIMGEGFGQVASSSSPTTQLTAYQALVQAFQAEQQTLAREQQALVAGGATPTQLNAWHQQNAAVFALQQQRAQVMAVASHLTLLPTNRQPQIPSNASSTLAAYLTTQAALANARAQIHNQLVQQATAAGSSLTFSQLVQIQAQESQQFLQQNASLLALQAQRSQALADEAAQVTQPLPAPLEIPSDATPQMTSYLTARYQIRVQLVQLRNQYATATPAVRKAALAQWYAQNASQLSQLQQQAQSLAQAGTTTAN